MEWWWTVLILAGGLIVFGVVLAQRIRRLTGRSRGS